MSRKNNWKIGVVGLGYVGLPLAVHLGKNYQVIGYARNPERIESLKKGHDPNEEVSDEDLSRVKIEFTYDPIELKKCNFIIVAVPTPINEDKKPDLNPVKSASQTVGENLTKGTVVVFESTVYPGVTEEICTPIIEQASGLKYGSDWKIGYSPERVNPGDRQHTIDKIIKVVSGMDAETLDAVAEVYGSFTKVHRAPNIKTAEAAKVIENIQRDLNIALMNELSLIFDKLGIKTKDVLAAASTKWNFHAYRPGLVGGHCIGVDPFYLTFKAQQLGYQPEVILAGRSLNDRMPIIVAQKVLTVLKQKDIENPKIYVMGLTFKENVKDYRNSKALDVINELRKNNAKVIGWDPLLDSETVKKEFGIMNLPFERIETMNAVIILAPHRQFSELKLEEIARKIPQGVLFDLTGLFDSNKVKESGLIYLTL